MTSARQIVANRANARRSTGPRTEVGREIAKLNAVKHGGLSPLPVLPALETPDAWEAHLAGTLASLAPVGHLETVLAELVERIVPVKVGHGRDNVRITWTPVGEALGRILQSRSDAA